VPEGKRYRLDALIKLRQQSLDAAEQQLAAARRNVAAAREDLGQTEADLQTATRAVADHQHQRRQQLRRSFRSKQVATAAQFERRLRAAVTAQQRRYEDAVARVAEAEQRQEQAREGVVAARQELEVMNRHRERHRADLKKDQDRREEAQLDDLAASRSHLRDP
jgi:flagellar biosynthesis chaperone FliJ